jgi:Skp family chaperone for outer membrane proteins
MRTRHGLVWSRGLAAVAAGCVGLGIAFMAVAQPGAKQAPPTAVAAVDVNKVLEDSAEAKAVIARLDSVTAERQKKLVEIENAMKSLQTKLEAAPKGSPDRQKWVGELIELEAQGKVRKEVLTRISDLEAGPELWSLYVKITDAAKQIAAQQGYDIVIADDSFMPQIPEGKQLTASDVRRTTTDRQLLYVGPRADITQQVITLLNNQFNAKAGNR